jgi:VanZ family protein
MSNEYRHRMTFPPRFARIKILIPVLFLVFGTTAIPIELRAPGNVRLSVNFNDIRDIVVNVLFYVVVGIALAELGPLRAVVTATLISAFAETSQFVMMYRDPSFTDVFANSVGAALGVLVSACFKIKPFLQIGRWRGLMAAVFLAAMIIHLVKLSDRRENPDGSTSRGRMEARWKLARVNGQEVSDDSGHDLAGKFRKQPPLEPTGPSGGAAVFDGTNYINLGNTEALRFAASKEYDD